MNYAPQLLECLVQNAEYRELFIAPHAMPVLRRPGELRPIGEARLSERDILDTLVALRAQTGGGAGNLGKEGSFSFGVSNVGRFRVWYLTQRGSYVVAVVKVPLEVPALNELILDAAVARQAEEMFCSYRRGLLVVMGPSGYEPSLAVYSLLKQVSEQQQRVMFIVEMNTMFLLKHSRSIVVQCELGTDISSTEQGIRSAFNLNADLLFVREVTSREDFELVRKASQMGIFVVVTMSPMDVDDFIPYRERQLGAGVIQDVWRVEKLENGKLEMFFHQ